MIRIWWKRSAVIVLIVMVGILLCACGEAGSVESIAVIGVNRIIEKDSVPDFSQVTARVYFVDKTSVVVDREKLSFGGIDTSILGKQDLVVTHIDSGYSVTVTITVVEKLEGLFTASFDSDLYQSMSSVSDSFESTDGIFKAGDDNYFDLQIRAKAISNGVLVDTDNCVTEISLQYLEGEEYIDGSNLATIEGNKIDFSDEAVGKTFRITVTPRYIEEGYEEQCEPLSMNVEVVDGFNVYNALDLSVISNVNENGWREFKEEHGYGGINPSAVILQRDINIGRGDIPSNYFYTREEAEKFGSHTGLNTYISDGSPSIEGSMKDGSNIYIYRRNYRGGEKFSIYGNYFQINYSGLPRCVVQSDSITDGYVVVSDDESKEKLITTHTSLFKFHCAGGDLTIGGEDWGNNTIEEATNSSITIESIDFTGNGARTSRALESGGIMIMKIDGVNSTIDNSLYRDCFLGVMYDGGDKFSEENVHILRDTKGYNCYNTLIYVWGMNNVTIEGGEFIGAGGPVLIADHVGGNGYNKTTGEGGYISNIYVIGSKMESFVTGNEPWFVSYGATPLVSQIKAVNRYYADEGSTFLTTHRDDQTGQSVADMINLKVVYKSGEAEGVTNCAVRGGVTFFDSREEFENYLSEKAEIYGLDMDTYSKQAITNKNNITTNSRYDASLDTTPYFIVDLTQDGGYVFKLAEVERVSTLLATYQATEDVQYLNSAIALAQGQHSISSNMIAMNDGNVYVIDGEILRDSGGNVVSNITKVSADSISVDSFTLRVADNTFAQVSDVATTDVNFYIFNGMGIVMQLYKM